MTYQKLLELAAKAAGYGYASTSDKIFVFPPEGGVPTEWNPLNDDGDALRLAVKLRIDIEYSESKCRAYYGDLMTDYYYEDNNNDPYAATRRAITRAAAEIVRSMK